MSAELHTMVHLPDGRYTCDCGEIHASSDQRDVFIHIEWALRQEIAAWESMPTYGQGYRDAEKSFRPMLERMKNGLTMDGQPIHVEQMRLMASEALRALDDREADRA